MEESIRENTTGGIVIAAGKTGQADDFHPLLQLGEISVVKRIVLTYQQAGIYPIVIITGKQSYEVERHLSNFDVIFLKNENYKESGILHSARIGLSFLVDKCHRIAVSVVNTPLFTTETLETLLGNTGNIVTPVFHGIDGYPICLDTKAAEEMIALTSEDSGKTGTSAGLHGYLKQTELNCIRLEIEDEGVILHAEELKQDSYLLENHNRQILHPYMKLSIEKETLFFDARTKLLLLLLQETHSVRSSCSQMALSCSKAWNIINHLEEQLGYPVVERRHGGSSGGKTELTTAGSEFLKKYMEFEKSVRSYAKKEFDRLFSVDVNHVHSNTASTTACRSTSINP